MTLTEISEAVAERVGSTVDEAHGFIAEAMEVVTDELDRGREVRIRGLGSFIWVPVPSRALYSLNKGTTTDVKAGYKLRFTPAGRFRTRRSEHEFGPGARRGNDQTRSRSR